MNPSTLGDKQRTAVIFEPKPKTTHESGRNWFRIPTKKNGLCGKISGLNKSVRNLPDGVFNEDKKAKEALRQCFSFFF